MGASVIVSNKFPPAVVEWDGKQYQPGEEIPDLPEREAKRLLAAGKVEKKEPSKTGKKQKPGKGESTDEK